MMSIENERQLNTAKDFFNFIKRHNEGVAQERTIIALEHENEVLRNKVDDLEREVRVLRDLLTIAGAMGTK